MLGQPLRSWGGEVAARAVAHGLSTETGIAGTIRVRGLGYSRPSPPVSSGPRGSVNVERKVFRVDPAAGTVAADVPKRPVEPPPAGSCPPCARRCRCPLRGCALEPEAEISGTGDPNADEAGREAGAQSAPYRGHAGQTVGGARGWGKRRRSQSRCATPRGAGAGRSRTDGWPAQRPRKLDLFADGH